MPSARPAVPTITPGLARIAQLFDVAVRARAQPYVEAGCVQIREDHDGELSGIVIGTDEYVVAFERVRDQIVYGCSCPYFQDRVEGCKHLWALALAASTSALVSSAATCKSFRPDVEVPFYGANEELDEAPVVESPSLLQALERSNARLLAERRSAWRRLAGAVSSERPRAETELVYFLAPPSAKEARYKAWKSASFWLALGVRTAPGAKTSGKTTPFRPARDLRPETLACSLDRELLAVVRGCQFDGAYSPAPHVVQVDEWLLGDLLEKLAQSGRCHVMPRDFDFVRDESWLSFWSGYRANRRHVQEIRIDYLSFLDWPLLARDTAGEWDLELRLEAAPDSDERDRVYAVTAKLVRGADELSADVVRGVLPSGQALAEATLVDVAPSDARWLASMQDVPELVVPGADVPEFAALVFGRGGVSRFALPAGYGAETAEGPPERVLELGAPAPRAIPAEVFFVYGKTRVRAAHPSRLVFLAEQRVLPRDADFESRALAELGALGFSGRLLVLADPDQAETEHVPEQASLSVAPSSLLSAVSALIAAGWQVFGEGKRLRALSSFEIAVESGLDWFELRGGARFADADAEVPFPRLLQALRQQQRLVQLDDGSHGLLPEEWAARFATLAELVPARGDALRVSKRQLGVLELLSAALPEVSGAEALAELRGRLERFRNVEPARPSAGFRGELREYQAVGLGFLQTAAELGFGACLADDMGLGKTIQVLAHLHAVHRASGKRSKKQSLRSLVVVPRSLLGNWIEEARRFTPDLRVHVHWGSERGEPGAQWGDAELILTTYGTLRLDAPALSKLDFELVVLDEAQAIKNEASATAKAAKLLRARQRLAMSGTPIENHLGELWSLFEFLNPGLLGELPGLKQAIGRARPSPEACALIRQAVRPFILRRTKGEVAKDLPERIEQTLYVELDREERDHYDELARHYRASIGNKLKELGAERATPHVLEALLRLRQAACHPGLVDRDREHERSSKVELLLEQLRAVRAEGHQALVFSQFTSLLAIVRRRLEEEQIPYEYLDGQTRDRAERVRRFQSDPSVGVFLISLKAGGVGLNLTAADYVFILDPWWNPAAEAQAIDRAHRIGQTRTVIAYRLLTRGTVEERVAELQNQKRELVDSIFAEGALSRKLTREDLEALLEIGSV